MNNTENQYKPDYVISVIVIALTLFGIIMVFSATYYSEQAVGKTGEEFFLSQVIGVIIGLIAMFILSYIDYRLFSNTMIVFGVLTVSIVTLIIVYFTGIRNGAHRWIDLGLFSLQPAEIARFALIILTAKTLSNEKNLEITRSWRLKEILSGLLPFFITLLIVALLILFEPSLTMTLMLFAVVLCIFIAAGIKWRWFVLLGVIAGAVGTLAIFLKDFRKERFDVFLRPWLDPNGVGYQPLQSLYALGSGGLFGVGLGNSKQKLLYLTYGNSDFILSIIGEELGFIGVSFLLIAFIILIIRCFVVAINCRDLFGTLLAVGITSTIAIQMILNVGVATCTIPPTGVPLPFISSGNTSLIIFMAEIGILLNISRQDRSKKSSIISER